MEAGKFGVINQQLLSEKLHYDTKKYIDFRILFANEIENLLH